MSHYTYCVLTTIVNNQVFCTVHCDTITERNPTKCTLFMLMVSFNSWCLLHVSNIMCSSSGRPFVHAAFLWYFFIHLCHHSSTSFHLHNCLHKCMKIIPYKTACTNGLPDDEHMILETCKIHQELN